MGEEDAAGARDAGGGRLGGGAGRGARHEGRDPPHAGALHTAHEAAGEDDTGDGESRVAVSYRRL